MTDQEKKYGIHGSLPENDPMRKAHLLGDNWKWQRWYASESERDEAFKMMQQKHPHYRIGDYASQQLTKIER